MHPILCPLLAAVVAAPLLVNVPLAAAAEPKVVIPFGKDLRLDGWAFKGPKERSKGAAGHATLDAKDNRGLPSTVPPDASESTELINPAASADIYPEDKSGDCTIEREFMTPKGS